MAAIRPVTPELPAGRNGLSFFQALHQSRRLGFQGVASHRAGEVLGVDEIRRRSDAVEFGRLSSADDRVRPVGGPRIGRSAMTPFSHRTQRLWCDVKAFHEQADLRPQAFALQVAPEQPGRLCGRLLPQAIKRSALAHAAFGEQTA